MKKFFLALTLIILFVIQTSMGDKLNILGVTPNILLVFVILYSLKSSIIESAIIGALCGFLIDTCTSWVLGYNALVMMYISIFTSAVSSRNYVERKLVAFLIVFAFNFIYSFFNVLISSIMISQLPVWYITYRFILLECLYNSVIAIVMIPLVNRLKIEYVRGI